MRPVQCRWPHEVHKDTTERGEYRPRTDGVSDSLTTEQESAIALRAKEGDQRARAELVRANLRSIERLAMRLRWYGVPVEDLVQEGVIGLLQSVPYFDPERSTRLLSFSARNVRLRMFRAIVDHRGLGTAGQGSFWGRAFFRIRREIDTARSEGENVVDAIATRLHTSRETAIAAILLSTSAPPLPCDEVDLCGPEPDPEQTYAGLEMNTARAEAVHQALSELTERERVIVQERIMRDPAKTYRGLGRRLGISGERVRQIETVALERLRVKLSRQGVRAA